MLTGGIAMLDDRRMFERRQGERRLLHMCEEFLAKHAGYCERLRMRVTQEGCTEIRNRLIPPRQCEYCPGVVIERRLKARRSGKDRRA